MGWQTQDEWASEPGSQAALVMGADVRKLKQVLNELTGTLADCRPAARMNAWRADPVSLET
jgi:hypothetical protein